MPEQNIYYIGKDKFALPDDKLESFLNRHPEAVKSDRFIINKDTFDVPIDKIEGFKSRYPEAVLSTRVEGTVEKKEEIKKSGFANFLSQSLFQPLRSVNAGVQGATANLFQTLDNYAIALEKKTGIKRGGMFGDLVKVFRTNAERNKAKGIPQGQGIISDITRAVYEGGGQLGVDLPMIMSLGGWGLPIYSAVMGGGEEAGKEDGDILKGIAKGTVEGIALHTVLKGVRYLPRGVGEASGGAIFGGLFLQSELQKPEGEVDWSGVAAQTLLGMVLTAQGKRIPQKEFLNNIKTEYSKGKEPFVGWAESKGIPKANAERLHTELSKELENTIQKAEQFRKENPETFINLKETISTFTKEAPVIKPKTAEKPIEAVVTPKTVETPAEAKAVQEKAVVEPVADKKFFTDIVKDIETQFKETGEIKSGENFIVKGSIIKIKSPQGEFEVGVPKSEVQLENLKGFLKRGIREGFKQVEGIRVVSGVRKRTDVLESIRILEDKTSTPKQVTEAKTLLELKGIGYKEKVLQGEEVLKPDEKVIESEINKLQETVDTYKSQIAELEKAETPNLNQINRLKESQNRVNTILEQDAQIKEGVLNFTPESVKKVYEGAVKTERFKFENLDNDLQTVGKDLGINKTNFVSRFKQFVENPKKLTQGVQNFFKEAWGSIKRMWSPEGGFIISPIGKKGKIGSDAKEVQEMFDRSRKESQEKHRTKLRTFLNKGVTSIVDVSGNIKRELIKKGGSEGQKAVMERDLVRGSGAKATLIMKEADSKIFKGLSKSDRQSLDDLIASRREIVIEDYKVDFKHMEGKTREQFTNFIESFKETNPKQYQKINALADEYFKVQADQFEQLNNAGLLTKETYNLLKDKEYSPRRVLDYIDPEISYTHEGRKINVTDSGLKRLNEGSYKLIETDSRALLSQVIGRTQTRIARNKANQALYNLALKSPDNGIVEIMKGDKVPAGKDMISVMIDGKKKDMLLPRKMAKEWVVTDPLISQGLASAMGWISGAKILRPMATGLNPEFAIANFPRDIMHIYLTALDVTGKGVYSKQLPVFTGQMVLDLKATAKDAFSRKGRFNDYIMEGGGMEFLTHQGGGGTGKAGGGKLGKVGEYLGYIGETSEIWTRLALRERALKQGKSAEEATWIARNYLDFAQGGNVAKAFDSGVPYLNAGIQGTRGVIRSLKTNPSEFGFKVAWIGATASSLWLANRYGNSETWDKIPDYVKAQNWVITTPFSFKDKKGDERGIYFTVAKDQGQRVIATGFEMMMSRAFDGKFSEDQFKIAMGDFLPYEPTASIPPTFSALAGTVLNKDFYTKKDIWRGYDKIDPSEEYYKDTHPLWKSLSKVGDSPTKGISPERTKYAVSQFLTRRNIYTDIVGGSYKLMTEGLPEKDKDKANAEIVSNFPFIRKGFKITPAYIKDKGIEETKIIGDTESFKRNRTLDAMVEKHIDGEIKKDVVLKHIRSYKDVNVRKALLRRFKATIALKDLSDTAWWQQVKRLSPEDRASEFYKKHKQLDAKAKKQLEIQSRKIPGFASDRFRKKLNQLLKEQE